MPMATAGDLKLLRQAALDACRAAVVACHGASGLCRLAGLQAATRASHCAEGLMRSAVAMAATGGVDPAPPGGGVPSVPKQGAAAVGAGRRRRKSEARRRKREKLRKAKGDGGTQVTTKMADVPIGELAGLVVGDLSELGVSSSMLVVDGPGTGCDGPPETPPPALALQRVSSMAIVAGGAAVSAVEDDEQMGTDGDIDRQSPSPIIAEIMAESLRNMELKFNDLKAEVARPGVSGKRKKVLRQEIASLEKQIQGVRGRFSPAATGAG